MRNALAASCFGLAALVATLAPAAAEKRVALIVGNSSYQHAPRLSNPGNDAGDMAAKLRSLGFEVVDGIDLGKRDMEKRIRAFSDILAGADVGLFYYAGHGLQVDGRNFLAPIDAELRAESDLDFEAVELELVLKQMVRNAPTSIVFLDACRDNPLATNLAKVSRSIAIGRGLARVETPASMMIVYATEPGKVALDGTGRNSPFTAALLRHIGQEGASISDVMIDVRNDVLKETGGQQRPFESASLTGQFYFKPRPETPAPSTAEEIASLRAEIARLQADQGALLKSQQEQLIEMQAKLAVKTGADSAPPPAASPSPSASPVAPQEPATATPASTPVEETKTAAVDSASPSTESPAPAENTAPLPETSDPKEVAANMQTELKRIGCYSGRVGDGWGPQSRLALERFNDLATLELPPEEPQTASLDALKAWKGPNCEIAAVTPKATPRPAAVPKKQAAPKKSTPSKAARPAQAPRQAAKPRPKPSSSGSGSAEIDELKRMFPEGPWGKN
jgi:uncharacterized caspase-like protein